MEFFRLFGKIRFISLGLVRAGVTGGAKRARASLTDAGRDISSEIGRNFAHPKTRRPAV